MTSDQPASQPGFLMQHVLAFTFLLREMGVDVSPGQALELVHALEFVPITSREDFRSAARCTLIRRHEDLPLFDTAFAFYWRVQNNDPMMLALPVMKVPAKPLRI
ncbi:CoxE, partial [Kouleothrix aurantiaca]